MVESLITVSFIGFIAGFVFSMPVAGPISIFITTNALKGEFRYCTMAAIGASIVDFLYCFVAVYSFTRLYTLYRPLIPYIFILGAIFLFFVGVKIIFNKIKLETFAVAGEAAPRVNTGSGFLKGFLLNFLNPSLFLGWLMSSFLIMSIAQFWGFNTGGLNYNIDNNVRVLHNMEGQTGDTIDSRKDSQGQDTHGKNDSGPDGNYRRDYQLFLSLSYAFFVALGTIFWFYYFSKLIIKYRKKLSLQIINRVIQSLGVVLCFLAIILIVRAIKGM